jgi:hypothetical protein
MAPRYKLTLFVTPLNSGKALAHLYKALENLAYTDYELKIVDELEERERLKAARLNEAPILVYHGPAGDVIVESVSDTEAVRKALGI